MTRRSRQTVFTLPIGQTRPQVHLTTVHTLETKEPMIQLASRFIQILICSVWLIGCSVSQPISYAPGAPIHGGAIKVGPWNNEHAGNPELAGVFIAQLPEDPDPELVAEYSKPTSHPIEVFYLFWNREVDQRAYFPDGRLRYAHQYVTDADVYLWERADYSFGSDPEFRRHVDPRRTARRVRMANRRARE